MASVLADPHDECVNQSRLLSLPAEVRNIIWREAISASVSLAIEHKTPETPAIIHTCRQICAEAKDMYKHYLLVEEDRAGSEWYAAEEALATAFKEARHAIWAHARMAQLSAQAIVEMEAVDTRSREEPEEELNRLWAKGSMLRRMMKMMGQGK